MNILKGHSIIKQYICSICINNHLPQKSDEGLMANSDTSVLVSTAVAGLPGMSINPLGIKEIHKECPVVLG